MTTTAPRLLTSADLLDPQKYTRSTLPVFGPHERVWVDRHGKEVLIAVAESDFPEICAATNKPACLPQMLSVQNAEIIWCLASPALVSRVQYHFPMSDLDALLAGIVANPHDGLRWLVLADWLDDHGQPERAELLRLHRELLRTCTEPEAHPERPAIHARIMELMRGGATPCVPRMTLQLPGEVKLPTVFIPPGSFLMGSPELEDDHQYYEKLHLVKLTKGFFLGVSPVTQAQWVSVTGENPSIFKGEMLPVHNVIWDEAVSFCEQVTELTGQIVRLPTEAEWEYSARGGTTTAFYWGDQLNGIEASCNGNFPYNTTKTGPYLEKVTPVGSYAEVSPHPWGLMDIIGNVWEWCSDWNDIRYYEYSPVEDPTGPNHGTLRKQRGGSFWDVARAGRSAFSLADSMDSRFFTYGFRVAFTSS